MRELSRDDALDGDVVARAVPVIETVIRRRCRHWKLPADLHDDLRSEAIVRLLRRLSDPELEPIGALDEYVAGLTSCVIDDLVRAVSPEWARLKHRVRYVLNHDDRFQVSTLAGGQIRCSLQRTASIDRNRVKTRAATQLAQTMIEILREGEAERAVDELVSEVAARTGVEDPIFSSADRHLLSPATSPHLAAESTDSLRQLWSEILALPLRQRLALLLNARDAAGDSILPLLVAAQIVTMPDLAETLEIENAEFERLWNELPLIDAGIAERLQITRQQVINLRKAARDRLARRTGRSR